MNQMKRRNFLRVGLGSAAVLVAPKTFAAEKALDLSSKQVAALFSEFAQTKKMSPELKAWLDDPVIQKIPPYKVFDNVWYVGLRWVAAYLIKTNDGYILIDTLHPPFVGHLIDNLALLNVDPSEIKYVLMTHGHFDHVGGATTLKPLFKNAKFAMGEKGWEESFEHLGKGAGPKTMIPKEMVLKDGETVTLGNTTVRAIATPGHTEGTFSYVYPVYADMSKQNLSPADVKAYIRWICDRRLAAMGMKEIFKVNVNPLPWVDSMLGVTHTNFFENRVVDYAKGALSGSWGDVWGQAGTK